MEFCPGCGKKSKSICKDCKPQKEINAKDIYIKLCVECSKYFYKNKWHKYTELSTVIKKITKESVNEKIDSINPILNDLPVKPGVQRELGVELIIGDDKFIIPANIEVTYCNICSKQQGDYFEGTLQLRNVNENIIMFVKKYFKKNSVFISKENKVRNGYDLTVTDKKKLQTLGSMLQKNHGGILKITAKHFSQDRQTSKFVYRVNAFYEAPDYKIGDVISVEKKVILIHKISKTIQGLDLRQNKNTTIDIKDKEFEVLKPTKTRISKIHPSIEVLDPVTFQSVPTVNQKLVKNGEKVRIVNDNGLYYLL